jgi:uncharacterized protein YneF (UPF0154 family)
MPDFICPICTLKKKNKSEYESHFALCKISSISAKERIRQVANYQREPTNQEIFQLIITLCEENAKLKKRLDTIETTTNIFKKKSVEEYLSLLPIIDILSFQDWLSTIIVTDDDFQLLIEKSLTECLKQLLLRAVTQTTSKILPIKAFTKRQNYLYRFEDNKWNPMNNTEIVSILSILSQRIIRKYIEWKNKNQQAIESNPQIQELDMQYMAKAIGTGKSLESRVNEIKKAIYSEIKEDIDICN